MLNSSVLTALARSFLVGVPTVEGTVDRASTTLGRNWRWLRPLARRYLEAIAGETRPRQRDVVEFILNDPGFQRARSKYSDDFHVARWINQPQQMQPVAAAAMWEVPAIESG